MGANLRGVLVTSAHLLSIPVYVAYEGFVRAINKKAEPLPTELRGAVELMVTDIDLDDVLVTTGARIPSGHDGLTLGIRVFIAGEIQPDSADDMALLIHELVHVRQCRRYGRLTMMRQYGVEWARVLSYNDHPLEVEARNYQTWAHGRLTSRPSDRP